MCFSMNVVTVGRILYIVSLQGSKLQSNQGLVNQEITCITINHCILFNVLKLMKHACFINIQ